MLMKWIGALGVLLLPLTLPAAAQAESRRLCDSAAEWTYTQPAPDVPARLQSLVGLWTGSIAFQGSSESTRMCLAVAITGVKADGAAASIVAWNLGSGNETANIVSKGITNWIAQTAVPFPGRGDRIVFTPDAPSRGRWYRYVLDFPTAGEPDTIRGTLYATRNGNPSDPSPAAWSGPLEAFTVTLKRDRTSVPPFAVPTN